MIQLTYRSGHRLKLGELRTQVDADRQASSKTLKAWETMMEARLRKAGYTRAEIRAVIPSMRRQDWLARRAARIAAAEARHPKGGRRQ